MLQPTAWPAVALVCLFASMSLHFLLFVCIRTYFLLQYSANSSISIVLFNIKYHEVLPGSLFFFTRIYTFSNFFENSPYNCNIKYIHNKVGMWGYFDIFTKKYAFSLNTLHYLYNPISSSSPLHNKCRKVRGQKYTFSLKTPY